MKMPGMKMTPLIFLLMGVIALSSLNPASSQSYNQFKNKHIDNSVQSGDNNYCNTRIRARKITDYGSCKRRNTFIHAVPATIKGLCTGRVGKITSNNQYLLTDCTHHPLNNNEMPPNCNYDSQNMKRSIEITCRGNVPVHFDKIGM